MLAFRDTTVSKRAVMAQLRRHAAADEFIKGQYWQDGKGCAVGCTIHSGEHVEYETRFGIPQMLARLEDTIFEGLPNADAKEWPLRFMTAVRPGADLSCVGWQFLHWLLADETVNPGIAHPVVRDAVKQCADALVPFTKGLPVDQNAWSAAWSAQSAESAARSAAWSAESAARSAAWSAQSAARSARAAARAAAWSAQSAESAARSAAWSAESAARSAGSEAYSAMAKKLLERIQAAPVVK